MKVLSGIMAFLFLLAVAVQYNDPDPLRWVLIYGAATAACVLAILGRMPRWFPALVAIAAVVWAAALFPQVIGRVAPGELFQEIGMDSPEIEEGREAVGLLLIALWMAVLAGVGGRRRRDRGAPSVADSARDRG